MAQNETVPPDFDEPLDSWKEIAAYLKREVRTVQRWEQLEALPVHRHQHQKRGSVYAFKSELDAWQLGRQLLRNPESEEVWAPAGPQEHSVLSAASGQRAGPLWRRGNAAVVLVCFLLLLVASGYLAGRHSLTQPSRQASKRIGAAAPPVVAVGDFNGDGKMDVVLARPFSHSILIFFGADGGILGAQTTYVIKGRVAGMATADFDRDGTSDLAVAAAGRIIILLAGKQMGFRRRQEIELPGVSTISAGDLNGDGKADLIASAGDPASIFVLWGSGDGTFSFPQPVSGAAMRLGPQASWLGR